MPTVVGEKLRKMQKFVVLQTGVRIMGNLSPLISGIQSSVSKYDLKWHKPLIIIKALILLDYQGL